METAPTALQFGAQVTEAAVSAMYTQGGTCLTRTSMAIRCGHLRPLSRRSRVDLNGASKSRAANKLAMPPVRLEKGPGPAEGSQA